MPEPGPAEQRASPQDAEAEAEVQRNTQGQGFDYAEFNRRKKAEASQWVASSPCVRLVCMKEVAAVLLKLMYACLFLTGRTFEKKQQLLSAKGKPRSYPVLEAWRGNDLQAALSSLLKLLWSQPKAIIPSNVIPHVLVLRFRLLSCALCSLHVLIKIRRSGCPFSVFQLLDGHVEQFRQIPACMRDPLADMIVESYDSCSSITGTGYRFVTVTVTVS